MRNSTSIKNKKIFRENFIVCISIIFIFLVTCYIKKIFPFGNFTVDTSDFEGQIVPFYYHVYDFLHGRKSLFFDWYTGLGSNMAGLVSHYGFLSPFNLLFLFIKREQIETFMTLFIAIKLVFIGLSMLFFLNKCFSRFPSGWKVILCLLYVFNGFTMQYFIFPMWLDIVFIFPLLNYYLFILLTNDKISIGYIISLSYVLLISIMQSYMVIIYIVLLTGIYLFIFYRKNIEHIKSVICKLFFCTVTSLCCTGIIILPGAIHILSSYRMNNNTSIIKILGTVNFSERSKWLMITGIGGPLGVLIYGLKKKEEKKFKYLLILIGSFLSLPIILESTNLFWHMGSYINFPMRFGYMLVFWAVIGGAIGVVNYDFFKTERKIKSYIIYLLIICIEILMIPFEYWILTDNKGMFWIALCVFIQTFLTYIIFSYFRNKLMTKINYIAVICQLVIIPVALIVPNQGHASHSFIPVGNIVYNYVNTQSVNNPLKRIKNIDSSLESNYPYICTIPALSNYIHLVNERQIKAVKSLGYAQTFTRLCDAGGTLFSDILMGMNSVIAETDINNSLYEKDKDLGEFGIYNLKNTFKNEGILINNTQRVQVKAHSDNPFINQNEISSCILGTDIFSFVVDRSSQLTNTLAVEGIKELYFYGYTNDKLEVMVNGKKIQIPNFSNLQNTRYPNDLNNGIISLGTFQDCYVKIEIVPQEQNVDVLYTIAALDLNGFKNVEPSYADSFYIETGKSNIFIELKCAQDNMELFLPVYADDGWECTVNGEKIRLQRFDDFFICVPLIKGNNIIKLKYTPPGMRIGIILTIVGLIFLESIVSRWQQKNKYILNLLFILFVILFLFIILLFYILALAVLLLSII